MSHQDHPLDAVQDAVDGRLDAAARARLDVHLRDCDSCRHEFELQSRLKQAVAQLPAPDLPADLAARISAGIQAIDRELPATAAAPVPAGGVAFRWRWAALVAAAAIIIVAFALQSRRTSTDWPAAAASSARAYRTGTLTMTSTTGNADALSRDLGAQVGFPVRVFDLGMMGYSIVGGRVDAIGDRVSALWVYRGADGTLLCEMYRGQVSELPRPGETREANGITFFIYHVDNGTQVFWQEGDIVCVLASDLPAESVIQLAIAKAMKP